jgi:hypothetical protein
VEKGEGTAEDWQRLAEFMQEAVEDSRERTFAGGVARIGAQSAPFFAEFFLSGGVGAVGKKVAKETGKAVVKKSISRIIGSAAIASTKKVASLAGQTALRMPVFSHRVLAGQARKTMPQFATVLPTEPGAKVEFVVLDPGEGQLEAAKNALGDVYIEVFSESTGEVVGLVGGPIKRALGIKPGRVGAREFLRQFGFHGMVGELAEERIGEGLRQAATEIGALDLPQEVPTGEQVAQEAVAFAIPGTAAGVAQRATRPPLPRGAESETAEQLIVQDPKAAKAVAAIKGPVSRKKLKGAVGDALTSEQIGRMNRESFRDLVEQGVQDVGKAAEREVEAALTPPAGAAPTPGAETAAAAPNLRSQYAFPKTKAGQELAAQLRDKLPEGLRKKVRVVGKGNKGFKAADGVEVAEAVGLDEMAQAILTQQTGKPALAIPAEQEAGRAIVRTADEIDTLASVPERRRDAVVKQEADARLAQDYAGERTKLVEVGRDGGQLSDTDTAVAKKIVSQEALAVALGGDVSAVEDAIGLMSAYRRTGTEQARGLRQRFDPNETAIERRKRSVAESLLTPGPKMEAQIHRHLDKGEVSEAKRLEARWAKQYGKLLTALKNAGIDIADIDEILADDVATVRLLGTIQTHKSPFSEALFEYWRNSILSAPTTQAVNIVGNAAFGAWHYTAERLRDGIVNTVVRNPEGVQWGEFQHMAAGILPGLSRGVRNFVRAWDSETPYFELSLGAMGSTKIEEPHIAIEGQKGKIVRAPQRMLLAFDELYKSLFGQMEVGAQAYRIAKADGLRGSQLQKRIADLAADTNSPAWDEAFRVARKLTFQSRESKALDAVLGVRRDIPGFRYLAPFVTTPWNIFGEGLRRSPVGVGHLLADTYRATRGTGSWAKVQEQFGNQLVAWSAVLLLMDNDPDDPWITGAASGARYNTRQRAYRTYPAQSIKVGETWHRYSRIEPMATWLSLAVDVAEALRSEAPLSAITKPFDNLAGQIQGKTFLQGVGDIVEVVERGFDPDALARWASSFAVSWIPNLIRRPGDERHEFVPERGVWAEGPEKIHRWMRRVAQKTGLGFVPDEPKIDLWGRPIRRGIARPPQSDFLWRVTVPMRRQQEDIAVGDRIIMNWNSQHPEAEYSPAAPRPVFTVGGEKRWLTDGEYRQFLELSGRTADIAVQRVASKLNVETPGEAERKVLERIITKSRDAAKKRLLPEWAENPMAERDPELVNRLLEKTVGAAP